MFTGFYDFMDEAYANELKVSVETWITVIEEQCTMEEAKFITDAIWDETEDIEKAKQLFYSKLKEQ
jgi:hypothetical protein